MDKDMIQKLAKEAGFTLIGELNVGALNFIPEVRAMCSADKCHNYGHCWTCPPYCGTLEESAEKASHYSRGVIVQTSAEMEDDFDYETISETEKLHKARFNDFVDMVKDNEKDVLPMSAGGCRICKKCTCPDEPCRFPDKAMISMEAYGLLVCDTCKNSGMKYSYGPHTITFTSCVLYNITPEP